MIQHEAIGYWPDYNFVGNAVGQRRPSLAVNTELAVIAATAGRARRPEVASP